MHPVWPKSCNNTEFVLVKIDGTDPFRDVTHKGLSTLDAYALRHGHSTIFPHAVKYVKNASLSTLDPFAASVST